MKQVEIYTKYPCGYCSRAKRLLDAKGIEYTEYDITFDADRRREMVERSKRLQVPQIFIGGVGIGGSVELAHLEATGELDRVVRERDRSDYLADDDER
jgi:glutaredoxin 3